MALYFPDIMESNNPQEYGIVKADQVVGNKRVSVLSDLYKIPDAILSATNNKDNDAIGLEWYVSSENKYYYLSKWSPKEWKVRQGGISNEVEVGNIPPTDPNVEVWVDTDDKSPETISIIDADNDGKLYARKNGQWVEALEKGNYLTKHQEIKTINNQSILGTGNINISGGSNGDATTIKGHEVWIGSELDYGMLTTKDSNTIYLVTEL